MDDSHVRHSIVALLLFHIHKVITELKGELCPFLPVQNLDACNWYSQKNSTYFTSIQSIEEVLYGANMDHTDGNSGL